MTSRISKSGKWPSFFIVGAPKAGTTSLYHYLRQHAQLFLPQIKEPHFFSPELASALQMERTSSEQDYLRLFDAATEFQLCGEASTGYLRAGEAPSLIKQAVPDAKIIMLLREPGERALSHYLMRWRAGGFRISFTEGLEHYHKDSPEYQLFRQLVIEPGMYSQQLARYLDTFGRQRVKVIVAEEFSADPQATVNDILAFLDVDEALTISQFKTHNDYQSPRGKLSLALLQHKHHLRFLKPLVPAQLKWQIIRRLFNKPADKPVLSGAQRLHLDSIFKDDIRALGTLIHRPDLWTK